MYIRVAGISLVLIFIFGLMFVFIFTQINFAFYRELFSNPEDSGLYCDRMYECFTTVFHRGLILSLFEVGLRSTRSLWVHVTCDCTMFYYRDNFL